MQGLFFLLLTGILEQTIALSCPRDSGFSPIALARDLPDQWARAADRGPARSGPLKATYETLSNVV